MLIEAHVALLAVVTMGSGWVMTQAGLQKSALEWKRRRRTCPSCGKHMAARVCRSCAS